MAEYSRSDAARRSGVDKTYVDRLIELGIISPDSTERLTKGDVRRIQMAQRSQNAGIPLESLLPASRAVTVTWRSWTRRPTGVSRRSATRRSRS
jgi:hypothetical protein